MKREPLMYDDHGQPCYAAPWWLTFLLCGGWVLVPLLLWLLL